MTDCPQQLKAAMSCYGYTFYNNVMVTILKLLPLCHFIMYNITLGRGESSILTLRIIFRQKINVNIYIEPRNGVKILKKWVLGCSIFTRKLPRRPLGRKKNILEYRVYYIQNVRLDHTVPTKQTVNQSEFRGPRYNPKRADI